MKKIFLLLILLRLSVFSQIQISTPGSTNIVGNPFPGQFMYKAGVGQIKGLDSSYCDSTKLIKGAYYFGGKSILEYSYGNQQQFVTFKNNYNGLTCATFENTNTGSLARTLLQIVGAVNPNTTYPVFGLIGVVPFSYTTQPQWEDGMVIVNSGFNTGGINVFCDGNNRGITLGTTNYSIGGQEFFNPNLYIVPSDSLNSMGAQVPLPYAGCIGVGTYYPHNTLDVAGGATFRGLGNIYGNTNFASIDANGKAGTMVDILYKQTVYSILWNFLVNENINGTSWNGTLNGVATGGNIWLVGQNTSNFGYLRNYGASYVTSTGIFDTPNATALGATGNLNFVTNSTNVTQFCNDGGTGTYSVTVKISADGTVQMYHVPTSSVGLQPNTLYQTALGALMLTPP